MTRLTLRACAKLNLTLDVTGRRPDGYHDMTMIMQSVDLWDTLTVETTQDGRIEVACGDLSGEDNLAFEAARRYLTAAQSSCGVRVSIEKRIPVCGGLAGGSADAAGVLTALDRLIGGVDRPALDAIALALGADVPFALLGGTALAEGVGERLKPLKPLRGCTFLLISAGEKDSTGAMFRRLDELSHPFHPDTDAVIRALSAGDTALAASGFGNAFSPLWRSPRVERIRSIMLENGAWNVSLSGAGPTLFGIFADDRTALPCRSALASEGEAILCHPTEKSILPV